MQPEEASVASLKYGGRPMIVARTAPKPEPKGQGLAVPETEAPAREGRIDRVCVSVSERQRTGECRMNRTNFLALAAVSRQRWPLGFLAANLRLGCTPAVRPGGCARPDVARLAEGGRRRGRRETPSWPRSRSSSGRPPRSSSRRDSPSGGRTSRAGPMCATASSSATSSPSRSRRP